MALIGAIQGKASGDRVEYGTVALDGSNPTSVSLESRDPGEYVKFAAAGLNVAAPTALSTNSVAVTWTGMTLNIEGYKPTGATDPTAIDSDGTQSVWYFAIIGR